MASNHAELSGREKEILTLVATGASNKEIALKLHISTNTVKAHLRHIFNKIEVSSRTEAAIYAVNAGMVSGSNATTEILRDVPAAEVFQNQQGSKWKIAGLIVVLAISVLVILALLATLRSPRVISMQGTTDSPRWQQLSKMPTPRFSLGMTAYHDNLYAIGGVVGESVTNVLERYHTLSDSWSKGQPKPTAVSEVGAAVISGRIYVPGGRLNSGEVTNVLEVYDPVEDSWFTGTALPKGISAYAISTFEGKLYLFGGWDGTQFVDTIYVFDSTLNTWREITNMTTPRGYAGATMVGDNILILGGYDGKKALSTIETFEPNSEKIRYNPLSPNSSMPQSSYGMGVTSLADMVYVVGGQGNDLLQYPTLIMVNETGEWGSFEAPSEGVSSFLGLVSWGPYIYAIGGKLDGKSSNYNLAYKAIYTVILPLVR